MKIPSGNLILAVLLCIFSLSAGTEPSSGNIARIPTVTRLVKSFTQLEFDIITAFKENDQTKLSQLIAQDFEMQVPSKSDDPIPLSVWLETSVGEGSSYKYDITNMSVYDLGQSAIVSFEWMPFEAGKNTTSPKFFIVDVWKKEAVDWKLAIRYSEAVQKSSQKYPGFSQPDEIIEKKY
jgi:hypothetical protein